jgi:hypothetical protein
LYPKSDIKQRKLFKDILQIVCTNDMVEMESLVNDLETKDVTSIKVAVKLLVSANLLRFTHGGNLACHSPSVHGDWTYGEVQGAQGRSTRNHHHRSSTQTGTVATRMVSRSTGCCSVGGISA